MKALKAIFGLLFGVATLWSYAVPDAGAGPDGVFRNPALARIFFFHFPCPILASVLLIIGSWFGWRYLRTDDRRWDVRSESSLELGTIFAVLTMVTGILFSEVQWGTWWQWDPRQTSFLLVLLIYGAYFALRGAISDEDKRASHSAAYALAALLPAMFLIFVFPRLPQVLTTSLHPTQSILGGDVRGQYLAVMMTTLTLMSILGWWLYRLRSRAGILELESELIHGKLENNRGAAAPTGVVRPVSVPHASREESPDR